ncbi:MAG: diacylglycerol/polyprenol kinase family protein [Thermoflexales bacterium]
MSANLIAIVISFGYVFAMLGAAEGLRRALRLPTEFTRKFVHIAVGMWAFGTVVLFSNKWFAIVPPAAFIVLNYISYRRNVFSAMEVADKSNLGTVYFPIAFVAILLLFFDVSKALAVAALMPMTWGDAFAAIVGRKFGKHPYVLLGATRSAEGSAAMFGFSLAATTLSARVFGLTMESALVLGLGLAAVSTVVEALSPNGLDNLLVPAGCAATIALLQAAGAI